MNPTSRNKRIRGFTFWDLLIVLVTVGLLAFLLPIFLQRRPGVGAARIRCVSRLRQVGLAMRIWSNDHNDMFPMSVSTNAGGSMEFTGTGEVFRHFQTISNELMMKPQLLTCPADAKRQIATNLASLAKANPSYFLGLDAQEGRPQMILSGDRNISTNGRLMSGILILTSNSPVSWTKDLHGHNGNIGLADGSAQQATDAGLNATVARSAILPVRLAIP